MSKGKGSGKEKSQGVSVPEIQLATEAPHTRLRDTDKLFGQLAKSRFRSRIKLREAELRYLRDKGLGVIEQHAYGFVTTRLAPAHPVNDGKQTPMRNHPVFVAQHATATCCRKCLKKWHDIRTGQELTIEQINYVVSVILRWIRIELDGHDK